MKTRNSRFQNWAQCIRYRILGKLHTRLLRISYFMALTKRDRQAIRSLLVLICITIALRAWGIVRPAKEWGLADPGNPFGIDKAYLESRFYQEAGTYRYARIAGKPQEQPGESPRDSSVPVYRSRYTPPSYMVKRKFRVDLNKADTFDLQELKGIGSTYSKRIIAYREKLGGFVHPGQLREVWGIDSLLYQRIAPSVYVDKPQLRKLQVNQADLYTLKSHPYLDYYQAKEIYLHRLKYGPFSELEQIRHVNLMDSGTFSRLKPYLSLENEDEAAGTEPNGRQGNRPQKTAPKDSLPQNKKNESNT